MIDDVAEVRRIVLQGLKGHAARIYFFGSRARGDFQRYSDIDVAVLPLKPIPSGVLGDIREALEESNVLPRVDLVDLSQVELSFRERVEREGIVWDA